MKELLVSNGDLNPEVRLIRFQYEPNQFIEIRGMNQQVFTTKTGEQYMIIPVLDDKGNQILDLEDGEDPNDELSWTGRIQKIPL